MQMVQELNEQTFFNRNLQVRIGSKSKKPTGIFYTSPI